MIEIPKAYQRKTTKDIERINELLLLLRKEFDLSFEWEKEVLALENDSGEKIPYGDKLVVKAVTIFELGQIQRIKL